MKDVMLTEDFDLFIENDDFKVGDTTHQNQGLIMLANKGEFRQFPFLGVGLMQYLHDERVTELKSELTEQLTLDGMTVNSVKVDRRGRVEIDASYE